MDGIKKLRNEPTQALQELVARCRPYFDRGTSQMLSPADRQNYYAALFLLAQRDGLVAMDWQMRDGSRTRDDRQRASQESRRRVRYGTAANAA